MTEVQVHTVRPPTTGRRRLSRFALAFVPIAVIAALVGYAIGDRGSNVSTSIATTASLVQSSRPAPTSQAATMIKRVLPSLVNVRVTQLNVNPFTGPQEVTAEGSGVILSSDGLIVTNNHVVEGAVSVTVGFTDGHETMRGNVVGTDPERDLAVIKVDATDLSPITLGRSGSLELGDSAFAIGFPLGLGPTVTRGIVSGLNRTVQVQGEAATEHLVGLLQTDAAINPGNSGGALVDSSGQLVGINTAAAQASAAENVGFAISVDEAVPVIRQIEAKPASQQAWLGVEAVSVDSAAAATALGLPPTTRGAAVAGVIPDSPAATAGIRAGDVIVSIGRVPIRSGADLTAELIKLEPGQDVTLEILTAQGTRQIEVELANRPTGL